METINRAAFSRSCYAKSGTLTKHLMCDGANANSSGCTCALVLAQDVQQKLSPQFASCVKLVKRSDRTYLALPRKFCYEHLPNLNRPFVFVGENEKEFSIEYSADWFRFYVGWGRFFTAHSLLEGDALVFRLIDNCKFKVYVVRSCRPKKADGAIQNPNVDASIDTEDARIGMAVKEKHLDYILEDSHQENGTQRLNMDCAPPLHQRDNLSSIASKGCVVKFQDVKRFEDFKIHVDGQILDSGLPLHAKMKYYELCCSQKMFLHDRIIAGLGSKLVTGMISETSSIADAIKSTSLTPSLHNFECWDRTLKAFEDLGMNVGFLRARIAKLVKVSREYQTTNQSKDAKFALVEAKMRALGERVSTMEALQKSIATLHESIKILEAEIDGIEGKNEELGLELKEPAAASW